MITELTLQAKDQIKSLVVSHLPKSCKLQIYNAGSRILPKHKLIYIHIPKTGGTSIAHALNQLQKNDETNNSFLLKPKFQITLYKHAKAYEMRRWLGNDIWSDFFSFAFVRNPWSLMVSSYHHWIQNAHNCRTHFKKSLNEDVEKIKSMGSFENFIKSDYGQLILSNKGEIYDWISENDNIIVDFIGKFETLEEDYYKVCEMVGLAPIALPHKNPSTHQVYQDYYTEETRQIVAERFHRTIGIYGYTFFD